MAASLGGAATGAVAVEMAANDRLAKGDARATTARVLTSLRQATGDERVVNETPPAAGECAAEAAASCSLVPTLAPCFATISCDDGPPAVIWFSRKVALGLPADPNAKRACTIAPLLLLSDMAAARLWVGMVLGWERPSRVQVSPRGGGRVDGGTV